MNAPSVQYARTEDGVSIAYSIMGSGRTLIHLPPIPISSQQNAPDLLPSMGEWADHFRNVAYDARGSGMSDRSARDFSLDAMLLDLRAILQRTQEGPAVLYAVFDSVPVAAICAARYPADISALILTNGWTRYSEYDELPARAAERAMRNQDWTLYTETLARVLMGSMFNDDIIARLGEYIRSCVDQETLLAAYAAIEKWDISDELSAIDAPTLVLFNQNNSFLTLGSAQRLAAAIPRAELRIFDDVTYRVVPQLIASWLDPDSAMKERHETVPSTFRTVLFTDLVGHTEMMARLGDDRGRDVLREHERITREVLKSHGGTEVKTMGDGFMASFGSVTKSVECAIALQRAFAEREGEPLSVRVGLNAGEPIEEDGDLFGATVILASRIAAKANAGEILVADTVRGLCSGKGFLFADRGEFLAKGFEEPLRVYEVGWR
jgi:class 3 adenylate cyclase/pimeloyl-ACP methyl ester carboxylesterase